MSLSSTNENVGSLNGSSTKAVSSDRMAKLGLGEKLGYGLGDAGFNLYWATISAFLAAFYTDVFGIGAAAAATMLLVTKIIDAFTDPLMGAIADRTNSRFGKFRPYLIWAGLPMAGAAILTFTTPDLDEGGKLVWAYGTYTMMMLMYTVLSTPYSSLSGVMTARSQDRTSLISIRFIFAFGFSFLVQTYTLDLVKHFGGADPAKGWQMTMILYGLAAALIFFITAMTTKERISPPATQKTNPLNDIADLLNNRAWIILFALAMIIMMTITMRGGSAYYYFMYFFERPDLLGAYLGVQAAAYMAGAIFAPLMTRFLDKAKLLMVLMGIVGILSIMFAFVPKPDVTGVITIKPGETATLNAQDLLGTEATADATYQWQKKVKKWWVTSEYIDLQDRTAATETFDAEAEKELVINVVRTYVDGQGQTVVENSSSWPLSIKLAFLFNVLIGLALGPKSPLTWSMYADTADYNEWKTGRRATAMTFSAATFSQKLGGALGSAGMLWVLAAIGYAANEAQSGASQTGIAMLQTAVPGIFALIAVVVTMFYNLTGSQLDKIQSDLKEREEQQKLAES